MTDGRVPNVQSKVRKLAERDLSAGGAVAEGARAKLDERLRSKVAPAVQGFSEAERARVNYQSEDERSLRAIADQPFHAMVDVNLAYEDGREKRFVLYANKDTNVAQSFKQSDGTTVSVLSWTHPAIVRSLSAKLETDTDLDANGYRIEAITAHERGVFDSVLPEIAALYEPGGRVVPARPIAVADASGKKAVKLGMTAEQGKAFTARARGMMFLTGAPGSGKTTVALQRSRFLINEGNERNDRLPFYTASGTRIFLPNRNLIQQCATLLQSELQLESDAVIHVEDYVAALVDRVWAVKLGARPRQRHVDPTRTAALRAFFGLCPSSYLSDCWKAIETQVISVLANAGSQDWAGGSAEGAAFADKVERVAAAWGAMPRSDDPLASPVNMDRLYREAGAEYEAARSSVQGQKRDGFDTAVAAYLSQAWDPLACIRTHFFSRKAEGRLRMEDGTAGTLDAKAILGELDKELRDRVYGPEALPWIGWLLRFSVPSEEEPNRRFRGIPGLADDGAGEELGPWPHVIIDEGQDLSVAEASLLSSRVLAHGALTVAADYRQVVSPVRGIPDGRAFKVGCPIRDRVEDRNFLLSQNKRQSASIAAFLMEAYREIFSESAPFVPDHQGDPGPLPRLVIRGEAEFPSYIRQLMNVFRKSSAIGSVALLQVNENESALARIRLELERLKVPLAPMWEASGPGLVTTSVERIKGLEYDACILLGLDEVDRSSLKHTENRVYVGLSRPMKRLVMICQGVPPLLRRINPVVYERIDA